MNKLKVYGLDPSCFTGVSSARSVLQGEAAGLSTLG